VSTRTRSMFIAMRARSVRMVETLKRRGICSNAFWPRRTIGSSPPVLRERLDVKGLVSFIVVGFALAGSPGPNTLSLAATGAAFGARRGLSYLVGLVVGMIAVMLVTASGVVGLLLAMPGATPIVATIATAYFIYLAFRIATAPPLAENNSRDREPSFAA